MTLIWKALYDKLVGDATLVDLLKHTSNFLMIQRGINAQKIPFSETRTEGVTFREWTSKKEGKGETNLRDITIMISSYSRKNDYYADVVNERIIIILDGVKITNDDLLCYHSEWDGFATPTYWDEESNAWRIDSRFRFIVAKK